MHHTSGPTTLRRLHPDDLRAFQAYRRDPVVAQFQGWEAVDDAQATGFLRAVAQMTPLLQPGQWAQIAIADSATDALLGDLGLHLSTDGTEAELGITLARDAQGAGHATRAVQMATTLIFDQSRAQRITYWTDARNAPARRLATRTGFTFHKLIVTDGVEEAFHTLPRPTA
ncbi:MAG: GNAT family N-acetyltransferase [Pseudomonadota bacterium]